jgi:general secretion pathway protein H
MSAIGEPAHPPGGFTLIEMLVVLAVLSLVLAILFPAVDKAMRGQAFAAAAYRVELGLRAARARAVGSGEPARFSAAADAHGFDAGADSERIPDTSVLSVPGSGVRFFPDGTANGGVVALRDGARERRWSVEGVTGRIERLP